MMKNNRKSKWRLAKLLVVLPLIGGLLWGFSKPEYVYQSDDEELAEGTVQNDGGTFVVKGYVFSKIDTQMVLNPETGLYKEKVLGLPLDEVSIVLKGKPIGTIVDKDGRFEIKLSKQDVLIFIRDGYKSKEIKPVKGEELSVVLHELESGGNP